MKKIVLLPLILSLSAFASFFNTEAEDNLKEKAEQSRLCKLFTDKAIKYEKSMRDDRLAYVTLDSYKKRATIFCATPTEDKVESNIQENIIETKVIQKVEKKIEQKSEKNVDIAVKISQEDKRLCKIFKDKIELYKKDMREDELAETTLASYQKRASIFCSSKPLDSKNKEVRQEDKRLCTVFNEGPRLCKIFNKKALEYEKDMRDDRLAKITLDSYKKRADIFCSKEELKEKDKKVYIEHNRLCKVFNDKVLSYQKDMRDDRLAKVTLESYKKRANYFCSKPQEEK